MPLFLDVHSLDDPVTLNDVTQAHDADLRTQGPHGVSYLRYWVDEAAGKIFCLVDAPSLTSRPTCTARRTVWSPRRSTRSPKGH